MQARAREFSAQDPKLYNKVGVLASTSISKNVDDGGRAPKWQKRTMTYEWPIENKTGRMRTRAETSALTWDHNGHIHSDRIFGPEYGIFQQYGTSKLPVRAYVKFLPKEILAMMKIFRNAFLRG